MKSQAVRDDDDHIYVYICVYMCREDERVREGKSVRVKGGDGRRELRERDDETSDHRDNRTDISSLQIHHHEDVFLSLSSVLLFLR